MSGSPALRAASFSVSVPAWLTEWEKTLPVAFSDDESAMAFAVEAAARNVSEKTGGPFGALIVDDLSGHPLAAGVNIVVSAGSSVLHAEIVAIMRAQALTGSYLASGRRGRAVTLYSSAEPCAMCMGAIPWSGISRIVCGARDEDVRAVGFDEGDKPADWTAAYGKRGIEVTRDILREKASEVLRAYSASAGMIY